MIIFLADVNASASSLPAGARTLTCEASLPLSLLLFFSPSLPLSLSALFSLSLSLPGAGIAAPGIRALLGLSPSQQQPGPLLGAPVGGKAKKRAPANARRAPRRSCSQGAALGARNQKGPSADPMGLIHQWFPRATVATGGTEARTPSTLGSSTDPPPGPRHPAEVLPPGTEVTRPRAPGAPGSSTEPPHGDPSPRRGSPPGR